MNKKAFWYLIAGFITSATGGAMFFVCDYNIFFAVNIWLNGLICCSMLNYYSDNEWIKIIDLQQKILEKLFDKLETTK